MNRPRVGAIPRVPLGALARRKRRRSPKLFAAETTLVKKIRVSVCNTLSAFAYNDDESGKEVGQMACNNGLFGGNSCCTWIIILLILSMCCGGEGGLFGGNGCNNCGCGNNCGCDNSCGC